MRTALRVCVAAALLIIGASAPSRGQGSYEDCFRVVGEQTGEHCNSATSMRVEWKNVCSEPMDIKVALQKSDGSWYTGVFFRVMPGQIQGYWTCRSTGIYRWWGRPAGSSIRFPTNKEIHERYR
ncbi:hypothetical protein K8I85_07080 [bacterium]|nr:hypothetical protein [bacterium]